MRETIKRDLRVVLARAAVVGCAVALISLFAAPPANAELPVDDVLGGVDDVVEGADGVVGGVLGGVDDAVDGVGEALPDPLPDPGEVLPDLQDVVPPLDDVVPDLKEVVPDPGEVLPNPGGLLPNPEPPVTSEPPGTTSPPNDATNGQRDRRGSTKARNRVRAESPAVLLAPATVATNLAEEEGFITLGGYSERAAPRGATLSSPEDNGVWQLPAPGVILIALTGLLLARRRLARRGAEGPAVSSPAA